VDKTGFRKDFGHVIFVKHRRTMPMTFLFDSSDMSPAGPIYLKFREQGGSGKGRENNAQP